MCATFPPTLAKHGWEFEARLRVSAAPGGNKAGLVFAFWTYKNFGSDPYDYQPGYSADEIDYELLGNWPTNAFNLANFQNFNKAPSGNSGGAYHWDSRASANVSGFDWTT